MEKKYIKALDVTDFDHQLYPGDEIKIYGIETKIIGFSAQYNDGLEKWETIIHTIGRGDPFERTLPLMEVLEEQPRSYQERVYQLRNLQTPPFLPADDAVQNWFEENITKECSTSSAVYKFRQWLEQLQGSLKEPTAEEQRVMNKTTDKLFVRDKPGTANDPEFIEFIVNERNTISKEMLSDIWWLEIPAAKRVAFENVLIAYDQMVEKIKNIK